MSRVEFLLSLERYPVCPLSAELEDLEQSPANTSPLLYLHRIGVLD